MRQKGMDEGLLTYMKLSFDEFGECIYMFLFQSIPNHIGDKKLYLCINVINKINTIRECMHIHDL